MDKKSRELVMGKLYFKNKDYKMAENSLIEYMVTNQNDFQATKLLAQVYEHLRNYPKAFELYEKCFLLEPDRKGVLLDLCRLLLMNEPSLSHVDQRKWVQLALQVFPANPIVLSLKSSLPEPKKENAPLDDAILAKLTSIDKRLSKIESMVADLKVSQRTAQSKPAPSPNPQIQTQVSTQMTDQRSSQAATQTPVQASVQAPVQASVQAPVQASVQAPVQAPVQLPAQPPVQPPAQVPVQAPIQATAPVQTQFQAHFQTQRPSSPKAPSPVKPPQEEPVLPKFSGITLTDTNPTTNLFANALEKFNIPQFSGFGSTDANQGTNLFASALEKYKIPQQNPWAVDSTKPTQTDDQENEDGDDDGDDKVPEEELPIENTCDMKPIEIKSGEEDEDILFEHRCKLFRFRDNEYKERGLGQIKVLKNRETGKGRLIMRRELVNLVCLNCWTVTKVARVRDTQVRFAGLDASDGEPESTILLVKFKNEQLTDTFMSHMNNLFTKDESN